MEKINKINRTVLSAALKKILAKDLMPNQFKESVNVSLENTLKASDGLSLNQTEYDFQIDDTSVIWEYDLNLRNSGIEDIYIRVPDQEVNLSGENLDTEEEFETTINLKDVAVDMDDWYYNLAESTSKNLSGIYPQELVYDNSGWTLKF